MSMAERDSLLNNLLEQLDDLRRRLNSIEQAWPGSIGTNSNTIPYFNDDNEMVAAGDIILDDGTGDSPLIKFVGGTADDEITIQLDDGAAGTSDLNVQMADDAAGSKLKIINASGDEKIWLASNGTSRFHSDMSLQSGAAGDSPKLKLVSGSNDDTGRLYLDDDAVANSSDMTIRVCDAGGLSKFKVEDSSAVTVFHVDSDGEVRAYNDLTVADGSGDSPHIKLIGGSNSDTARIFLDDDATIGDSDLVIRLCDAAGDSRLNIQDSGGTVKWYCDSDGNWDSVGGGVVQGNFAVGTSSVYKHTDIWGDFQLSLTATIEISGGVFVPTCSFHIIDSEGASGNDDLDTINDSSWGSGTLIIFRSASGGRQITFKDGTGNMQLAGDFTLDNIYDRIMLIKTYSWWVELCRSNNA
jgi:hypothetical protein